MAGLKKILQRFRSFGSVFDAQPAPDQPFVAVGDVHGRHDLLTQLLRTIDDHAPDLALIFVGDYVDRGPGSAAVLRTLVELQKSGKRQVSCLMGNHEAMMIDFIDMPENAGPTWLANGGGRTLESFGLVAPEDHRNARQLRKSRDDLAARAGTDLIDWVRNLPLVWQSGNLVVTHAGGNPSLAIEPRRGHGLLWGHRDFLSKPREDGLWVVHGHYIVREAGLKAGRVAVDTGAYSTGCLSAAVVRKDSVRFIST